jgi:hypothetical protein
MEGEINAVRLFWQTEVQFEREWEMEEGRDKERQREETL